MAVQVPLFLYSKDAMQKPVKEIEGISVIEFESNPNSNFNSSISSLSSKLELVKLSSENISLIVNSIDKSKDEFIVPINAGQENLLEGKRLTKGIPITGFLFLFYFIIFLFFTLKYLYLIILF